MLIGTGNVRQVQSSIAQNSVRTTRIDASKEAHSQRRLEQHIHSIASECSNFAHQAIRISLTGETRLIPSNDSFINEMYQGMKNDDIYNSLIVIDNKIHDMRIAMLKNFKDKKNAGISRNSALAQAFGEHIIKAMSTNTGNCAEKAMLAGILIKASMTSKLKDKGFTDQEIENANIEVSIAENGNHDGDHTVCILSYNINGKKELIVDPWLHGNVYDQEDAPHIYAAQFWGHESFIFDKTDNNQTQAINDPECIDIVLEWAKEILGNDQPFKDLLQHTQLSGETTAHHFLPA